MRLSLLISVRVLCDQVRYGFCRLLSSCVAYSDLCASCYITENIICGICFIVRSPTLIVCLRLLSDLLSRVSRDIFCDVSNHVLCISYRLFEHVVVRVLHVFVIAYVRSRMFFA